MPRKALKTFFKNHPKLFELAFAGTIAVGTITIDLNNVTGNAGP